MGTNSGLYLLGFMARGEHGLGTDLLWCVGSEMNSVSGILNLSFPTSFIFLTVNLYHKKLGIFPSVQCRSAIPLLSSKSHNQSPNTQQPPPYHIYIFLNMNADIESLNFIPPF